MEYQTLQYLVYMFVGLSIVLMILGIVFLSQRVTLTQKAEMYFDEVLILRKELGTLQMKYNEALLLGTTNELTKLPNKSGMESITRPLFGMLHREELECLSIVAIDLKGLKWVNDNIGHNDGDRYICAAAEVLQNTIREADVVGHHSGDEFVIVFTDTVREGIEVFMERALKNLTSLELGFPEEVQVGFRYGIATAMTGDADRRTYWSLYGLADDECNEVRKREGSSR